MSRINKRFTIVLSLVILFLSFVVLTTISLKKINASNSITWYTYGNEAITPDNKGTVSIGNDSMYAKEAMNYTEKDGVKSVKIIFSTKKKSFSTHQLQFILSTTQFANYDSYKSLLGTKEELIGHSLVYQTQEKYDAKTIQIGSFSGTNKWKNSIYPSFDPTDGKQHTMEYFFSTTGVWAAYDGEVIKVPGTDNIFYFPKTESTNYTVADFTSNEEFKVYFGIDGAHSWATSIYDKILEEDDYLGWMLGDGKKTNKNDDNEILSKFGGAGLIYTGNMANKEEYLKSGKIEFQIEFSYISSERASSMIIPYISNSLYLTTQAANSSLTSKTLGISGVRMYYQTDEHIGLGKLLVRASDCTNNYASVKYFTNKPAKDETHHIIKYVIDDNGINITLDGESIDYLVKKDANTIYTVSDFVVEGEPVVYWGLINGGFGQVTIYSDLHDDYVEIEEEEEEKEPEIIVPDGLPYSNENYRGRDNKALTPSDDGSIALSSSASYYYGNLADKTYYEKYNALKLKVEFSVDSFGGDKIVGTMGHILFSCKPLNNGSAQLISQYGKEDGYLIDITLRYIDAQAVQNNKLTLRILDCAWGSTVVIDCAETKKFIVQLDVTSEGTTVSINGKQLGGYLYKSTGVKWKINHFEKEKTEGEQTIKEPQIYLGFVCGQDGYGTNYGPYRIHSIKTDYSADELPTTIGQFSGVGKTLKEENSNIVLLGGNANTQKIYEKDGIVSGKITVINSPENEESEFTVFLKNNIVRKNAGHGLYITFKGVFGNGTRKTSIVFGVISDGAMYSQKSFISDVDIIGVHNYSFVFGNGFFTLVADDKSAYIGTLSNGNVMAADENLGNELAIYYSGDELYLGQEKEWKVILGEISQVESDEICNGLEVSVTGEQVVTNKVITGDKKYTFTDNGANQVSSYIIRKPFAIFGRQNKQIQTSVKIESMNINDYIYVLFSTVEEGSIDTTNSQSFIIKLTKIESNKYNVLVIMGESNTETIITSADGLFNILLGFNDTKSLVKINDKLAGEGNLSKGMFVSAAGQNGYLSFITKNGGTEDLKFEVASPIHFDGDIVVEQENEDKDDTNPTVEKKGCGSNINEIYTMLFLVFALIFINRGKNYEKKN